MILPMSKLRVLGPRVRLETVLDVLQELGVMHLAKPRADGLVPVSRPPPEVREQRYLRRLLADAETALALLEMSVRPVAARGPPTRSDLARWARGARRVRGEAERLTARMRRMEEEHSALVRFRGVVDLFAPLLEASETGEGAFRAYYVVVPNADAGRLGALERIVSDRVGDDNAVVTRRTPEGDLAVLVLIPEDRAVAMDRLLAEVGVHELPVPAGLGATSFRDAAPVIRQRLRALPEEMERIRSTRRVLARDHGETLLRAVTAAHDRLLVLDGMEQVAATGHAFVIEGWVPDGAVAKLQSDLERRIDPTITVERLARATWEGEPAPVVLRNPRVFQPFELLTSLIPLPQYGTIDPTPFVAVFFPMFFGLILGDIGYGGVLGALALAVRWRSRPATTLRAVSEIAGAAALFTVAFGAAFGECFGDLGRRWFGLEPLVFDREESVVPFLGLAITIGLVHVVLGLVLGGTGAFRGGGKRALGRGLSAIMVVLVAGALLAAFEVLPRAFFTPTVLALLVAFPVLIALEGVFGPIEFLSTLGNVLSYARIMALGTASVLMAIVANRMVGAFGSVLVGALFALLFHFVNFVLGVFSPTIHALRLHYVEFFGKFFSPGGVRYEPFAHWGLSTRVQ